ncbi:ABC transporter ATP-binding protein [Bradyrhizobium liaoningense]
MMPAALRTRQLRKDFAGVTAVKDVDLVVRAGELRCLIGPNGAGKTTFFKCVTGLLRPTFGTVEVLGENVTGSESYMIARLGVGIKTQVPSLFGGLSVWDNVWLGARQRGDKSAQRRGAQQALERMGIAELRSKQVNWLSHGERQLVELAVVMAAGPNLILLDEPAAGMAFDESQRVAEIIKDWAKTAAIVVVEHDMRFMRALGGAATVFHQGAILLEGNLEEVLDHPVVRDVYLGRSGAT